jgi:hypothetical protein
MPDQTIMDGLASIRSVINSSLSIGASGVSQYTIGFMKAKTLLAVNQNPKKLLSIGPIADGFVTYIESFRIEPCRERGQAVQ